MTIIILNGLTYLTTASLADYPTTTYQSQSATTQFIDLEKQSLPRSLQQVIISWESLIKSAKQIDLLTAKLRERQIWGDSNVHGSSSHQYLANNHLPYK